MANKKTNKKELLKYFAKQTYLMVGLLTISVLQMCSLFTFKANLIPYTKNVLHASTVGLSMIYQFTSVFCIGTIVLMVYMILKNLYEQK